MAGVDIFLSYARADRASARIFADRFAHEGFKVWWDAALHSGETFDEVIEKNLRDSKAVVVLWSPRSVASRWVRAEATLADRRHKLVPAIIEPCDRPIIFELTHAADLTEWAGDTTDHRWRDFMVDLRRLVDADSDETPASDPPAGKAEASAPQPAPVTRQPLRPGAGEVLFAGRTRAEPVAHLPSESEQAQPASDGEANRDDDDVHCLEMEAGDLAQETFAVGSRGVKVGRTAPADIILSHKSVSREHCSIGLANDELFVTDLNSTNGTFIDGERIRRTTVLPVGSVVQIGQICLKHTMRAPDATADRGDLHQGRLAAMR